MDGSEIVETVNRKPPQGGSGTGDPNGTVKRSNKPPRKRRNVVAELQSKAAELQALQGRVATAIRILSKCTGATPSVDLVGLAIEELRGEQP